MPYAAIGEQTKAVVTVARPPKATTLNRPGAAQAATNAPTTTPAPNFDFDIFI